MDLKIDWTQDNRYNNLIFIYTRNNVPRLCSPPRVLIDNVSDICNELGWRILIGLIHLLSSSSYLPQRASREQECRSTSCHFLGGRWSRAEEDRVRRKHVKAVSCHASFHCWRRASSQSQKCIEGMNSPPQYRQEKPQISNYETKWPFALILVYDTFCIVL